MFTMRQTQTASEAVWVRAPRLSAVAVALAFVLCLLTFAPTALAGPPTHTRQPALDIGGFNHACGTAVDSQGAVYVASAGESKIKVFNGAHVELTSIPNLNEPCGLAVDSKGNLYVSESKTGNVVKYLPNAYPFAGTPTYGAPITIDASGDAEGIAVDAGSSGLPTDDGLYIAKGDHIDAYSNEAQQIAIHASGGSFTLTFNGQSTASLPYNASHAEVQAALEGLSTIGAGDVSVTTGNFAATDHLIIFGRTLGLTDVSEIEIDKSGLTGGPVLSSEAKGGLIASIGTGDLTNAVGVAAYVYPISYSGPYLDRPFRAYVFAADTATDQVKVFAGSKITDLKFRKAIDGPKAGEDFGFGTQGAYLAVDPGNADDKGKCASIDEQACTAGHFLVYDDAHNAVDEFEASGEFLDQFTNAAFADAEPTALAVDRSGTVTDGTIYLTAGAGAGAKLLAFGPLAIPSRLALPELSRVLATAQAVATDSEGNVYVAAGPLVHVYGPDGKENAVGPEGKGIPTGIPAGDLAVDSTGKVYVLTRGLPSSDPAQHKVQYYTPSSYPPETGTQYSGPTTVASGNSFLVPGEISSIGIDPSSDRLFVGKQGAALLALGSAAEASPVLNNCFGCTLGLATNDVAVDGATDNVYVLTQNAGILLVDPTGTGILTRINGSGSPKGTFNSALDGIAVNQSNGHVLSFALSRGGVEEYDASGAFVAEFGKFTPLVRGSGIAIDNSGGPSEGNVYVAYDDSAPGSFDVTTFGPLAYGEAPSVLTGSASGLGAGSATLSGTLDPRGFELEDCHFEYLTDADYLANGKGFAGATSVPCVESLIEIGKGTKPVAVHTDISGLDPEVRYRFRLVAENKYGSGEGAAGLFGPPLPTTEAALPVLYDEATLRAQVDPSGLETTYHFQYGTSEAYDQSTPVVTLPPGDGPLAIEAPLSGLAEGTTYHFRIVAENEAKAVEGPDQTLTTLTRAPAQECPNVEYRTGLSTNLPDCRAYELVTPAETQGLVPGATTTPTAGKGFNNWLAAPRGAGAGESLAYFIVGTLPGFEGNGKDGYRAQRTEGEGPHPAKGWGSQLASPSYAQTGVDGSAAQYGVASDQRYWFYQVGGASEAVEGTLPAGEYLRTPSGFEPIGKGSLGTDMDAEGLYVSSAGAHVIFSSGEHLEDEAAAQGTTAVYDRATGSASAEVVSVKPDGGAFGAGEDATYVAASEDGSAVVFKVAGTLYLHRSGTSAEIAEGPNAFAGISEDGKRVFYAKQGDLYVFDATTLLSEEIAEDSTFVNVSANGSHALFTSEEAGEDNLYAWDGAGASFIGVLDPQDFVSFGGNGFVNLLRWTESISAGVGIGRSNSPTRSTPDGRVFVFQSHARLTAYDNEGHGAIYRYVPAAAPGSQLSCVSCDPTGAPPSADAEFLVNAGEAGVVEPTTMVANVTDDGEAVFFQSPDRLLPEDANSVQDVYRWKAPGATDCKAAGGCLALISSGQGEEPSYLYGMSADGHDVFFETSEKLVGQDIPASPSIYDARVEGGIPDPPAEEDCQGDACQGAGSTPPVLPAPASSAGAGNGNVNSAASKPRCAKGKRKVRRGGKTRCVKRQAKKHRANANRGAKR